MNFSYSDVYGEKRNIGITLTGTVHSQPGAGSTTLQSFERKNDPGQVFNYSMGRRVENATRSRVASGLKVDYRWSPRTTVSVSLSYNYYFENPDTRLSTLATVGVPTAATPNVLATVDAAGRRTAGGPNRSGARRGPRGRGLARGRWRIPGRRFARGWRRCGPRSRLRPPARSPPRRHP